MIVKCLSQQEITSMPKVFPSVHDAVQWSLVVLNLNGKDVGTVNVISSTRV